MVCLTMVCLSDFFVHDQSLAFLHTSHIKTRIVNLEVTHLSRQLPFYSKYSIVVYYIDKREALNLLVACSRKPYCEALDIVYQQILHVEVVVIGYSKSQMCALVAL